MTEEERQKLAEAVKRANQQSRQDAQAKQGCTTLTIGTFGAAYAAALDEWTQWHGQPVDLADWEREYFPAFMAAQVTALMADVTDPESLADLKELTYAWVYAQVNGRTEWHLDPNDARLRTRHAPVPELYGRQVVDAMELTPRMLRALFAVHEAGHLVADVALGFPVVKASLVPGHGMNAWVEMGSYSAPWADHAVMLAAGVRAVDRWLREIGLWTERRAWLNELTGDADQLEAIESAAALPWPVEVTWGDGGTADWARLCDQADVLLHEHWGQVGAIAAELLRREVLTGEEIAAVYAGTAVAR